MRWLDHAISLSLANECYPLLLYALERKKHLLGHGNEKELLKGEKQIEYFETEWKGVRKAVLYFYLLGAIKNKAGKPDLKKIGTLNRTMLCELKTYYDQEKSPTILYYMSYLRCDDCQNKKHYSKALKHLHAIKALMKKHPSVLSRERMGFVNDNLAQNYTMMGRYKTALKYLHRAQEYLSDKNVNMAISQEQQYLALMQLRQYDKAKEVAGKMFQNPEVRTEKYKYLSDKILFYSACALFQSGDYAKARKIIREKLSIVQDKCGWAFSLRLLELFLLLEIGGEKEVHHCLQLLDKFIAYHRSNIPKRNQLIIQTISLLRTCKFNPDVQTLKKIKRMVALLGSSQPDYCWDSQGDEVIRFDGWVKKKYLK